MAVHHEQAVEMASYASTRAGNAQVKALAAQIGTEQQPEISKMSGWLMAWGQPAPASMAGHDMGGMNHASGMVGMMSDADMTALQALSGAAFNKMWLSMMTDHHNGALEMAKTELAHADHSVAAVLAVPTAGATDRQAYGGHLSWPAAGTFTGGYGARTCPVTGAPGGFHPGVDIAASSGAPIAAAAAGTVVLVLIVRPERRLRQLHLCRSRWRHRHVLRPPVARPRHPR